MSLFSLSGLVLSELKLEAAAELAQAVEAVNDAIIASMRIPPQSFSSGGSRASLQLIKARASINLMGSALLV